MMEENIITLCSQERELSFYLNEHTGEQRLDTSFIDSNRSINDIITILRDTLPEEDSPFYGALMRHESWDKRKTPITQNQINYLSQIFRQVNFRESVFSYAKEKEFDRISDKNVFLCGRTGTGKTTTLLSIYGGILLRDIYNLYTVKPLFLKWEHITNSNFWKFFRRERYQVIFIDDFMNSEFTDTFDSKNCSDHFRNFLREQYDNDCQFYISTNTRVEDIEEQISNEFGESVFDRIKGVYTPYTGESLRK